MNCVEVSALLELRDGDARCDREELRRHLAACPDCAAGFSEISWLLGSSRGAGAERGPPIKTDPDLPYHPEPASMSEARVGARRENRPRVRVRASRESKTLAAAAAILLVALAASALLDRARPTSGGGSGARPAPAPAVTFRPHVTGTAATFAITTEHHGRRAFTSRHSRETWSPACTDRTPEDPR